MTCYFDICGSMLTNAIAERKDLQD